MDGEETPPDSDDDEFDLEPLRPETQYTMDVEEQAAVSVPGALQARQAAAARAKSLVNNLTLGAMLGGQVEGAEEEASPDDDDEGWSQVAPAVQAAMFGSGEFVTGVAASAATLAYNEAIRQAQEPTPAGQAGPSSAAGNVGGGARVVDTGNEEMDDDELEELFMNSKNDLKDDDVEMGDVVLPQIQDAQYDIRPPINAADRLSPAYTAQFVNLDKAGDEIAQLVWVYYIEGLHMHRDPKWTQNMGNTFIPQAEGLSVQQSYFATGVKVDTREGMSVFAKRVNKIKYIEDLMYGPDDASMRIDTGKFRRDRESGQIMWTVFTESTNSGQDQKQMTLTILGEQVSGRNFHKVQWTTRQILELINTERSTFEPLRPEHKLYGRRLFIEPVRLPRPRHKDRYKILVAPPERLGGAFRKRRDAEGRVVMDEERPEFAAMERIDRELQGSRRYVKTYNFMTNKWLIERYADGSPRTEPRNRPKARNLITTRVHFAVVNIRLNNRHLAWRYSRELRNTNLMDTPTKTLTQVYPGKGWASMRDTDKDPRRYATAIPLLTPRSINVQMLIWRNGNRANYQIEFPSPYKKVDFVLQSLQVRPRSMLTAQETLALDLGAETMPKPFWFMKLADGETRGGKGGPQGKKGLKDIRMHLIPQTEASAGWKDANGKRRPSGDPTQQVRDYSALWSEAMARPVDACDATVETFPPRGAEMHDFDKDGKWVPAATIRSKQFMSIHFDQQSQKNNGFSAYHYPSRPTFPKVMMFRPTFPLQIRKYVRKSSALVNKAFLQPGEPAEDGWNLLCRQFLKHDQQDLDPGVSADCTKAQYREVELGEFKTKKIVELGVLVVRRTSQFESQSYAYLVPTTIEHVLQRYAVEHSEMLQYHRAMDAADATPADPSKRFLKGKMLDTDGHLNGPGGMVIEARVDEGNQQFKGGYDSLLPFPSDSTLKTIDLRQVRGLHEIKAFQSQTLPDDTRIGPPHWWREERRAQMDSANQRTVEMNAHTDKLLGFMDGMRNSVTREWKNDCSTPDTWKRSDGEAAVAQRKLLRPNDETAQHLKVACVGGEELRDNEIVRSEPSLLPHVADAADPPELIPMGRLEENTAETVRQRMFQTKRVGNTLGGVELQPTMRLEQKEDGSFRYVARPDTLQGQSGRPLPAGAANRFSLATPLYVTMLDHDDLWFAETRTDRAWNALFSDPRYEPFLVYYDQYVEMMDETQQKSILVVNDKYVPFTSSGRKAGTHATGDAPRTVNEMIAHCYTCKHLNHTTIEIGKLLADLVLVPEGSDLRAKLGLLTNNFDLIVAVDTALLLHATKGDFAQKLKRMKEYLDIFAYPQELRLDVEEVVKTVYYVIYPPKNAQPSSLSDQMVPLCMKRGELPAWKCMTDASTAERFPKCVRHVHRYATSFHMHRAEFGGCGGTVEEFRAEVERWCAMYEEAQTRLAGEGVFSTIENDAQLQFKVVKGASFRLTWFSQLLKSNPGTLVSAEDQTANIAGLGIVLRDMALELTKFRVGVALVRNITERFHKDKPEGKQLYEQYTRQQQTSQFPTLTMLSETPLHWPDDEQIDGNRLLGEMAVAFAPRMVELVMGNPELRKQLNAQWRSTHGNVQIESLKALLQMPKPLYKHAVEIMADDRKVTVESGPAGDPDTKMTFMIQALQDTALEWFSPTLQVALYYLADTKRLDKFLTLDADKQDAETEAESMDQEPGDEYDAEFSTRAHMFDRKWTGRMFKVAEDMLSYVQSKNPSAAEGIAVIRADTRPMSLRASTHIQNVDAVWRLLSSAKPDFWYVDHLKLTDALLTDVEKEEWDFTPTELEMNNDASRKITTHIVSCYMFASRIAHGQSPAEALAAINAVKTKQGKRKQGEEQPDVDEEEAARGRRVGDSFRLTEQLGRIMQTLPNPTGDALKYDQDLRQTLAFAEDLVKESSVFEAIPEPIRELWRQLETNIRDHKKRPKSTTFAGIPLQLANASTQQIQTAYGRELNQYKREVIAYRIFKKELRRRAEFLTLRPGDSARPREDLVVDEQQASVLMVKSIALKRSMALKRAALQAYQNGAIPIPVPTRYKPRTSEQVQLAKNLKDQNKQMKDDLYRYGIRWVNGTFAFGNEEFTDVEARQNLRTHFLIDPDRYTRNRVRLSDVRFDDSSINSIGNSDSLEPGPILASVPVPPPVLPPLGSSGNDMTAGEIEALLGDDEDNVQLASAIYDGLTSSEEVSAGRPNSAQQAALEVMRLTADNASNSQMHELGEQTQKRQKPGDDEDDELERMLLGELDAMAAAASPFASVAHLVPGKEHDLLTRFFDDPPSADTERELKDVVNNVTDLLKVNDLLKDKEPKPASDPTPDPKPAKNPEAVRIRNFVDRMDLIYAGEKKWGELGLHLLQDMANYYNLAVMWMTDVLMYEHRLMLDLKRLCTLLYLEYAKMGTPTPERFFDALNKSYEASPNVALLPNAARREMGNYFDGPQCLAEPHLLSGDELYGYKGAWVEYVRSHVEWSLTGNPSRPYKFVAARGKEAPMPMPILQWLGSHLNTGAYELPPYAFVLGEDGGYPTSFELSNYSSGEYNHVPIYTRAEVAAFLHSGNGVVREGMKSIDEDWSERKLMHELWHMLEKPLSEKGVPWFERSPVAALAARNAPSLCMFETSWDARST